MECLLDASFLGKLLLLPANVRLDWKEIARYKHSSLFGLIISDKEKKFYKIDTWSMSRWVDELRRRVVIVDELSVYKKSVDESSVDE